MTGNVWLAYRYNGGVGSFCDPESRAELKGAPIDTFGQSIDGSRLEGIALVYIRKNVATSVWNSVGIIDAHFELEFAPLDARPSLVVSKRLSVNTRSATTATCLSVNQLVPRLTALGQHPFL